MIATVDQLQEERRGLANRIRQLAANAAKWNGEDKAEWDRVNRAYDVVSEQIKGAWNFGPEVGRGDPNATPRGGGGASVVNSAVSAWALNAMGHAVSWQDEEACRNYGQAINSNVFHVKLGAHAPKYGLDIRNALAGQDGTAGGFTIPTGFVANLERAQLDYSGVMQACEIMKTSTGVDLPWPTTNDTGNTGYQIGENTEVAAATDPAFAQVIYGAYMATSGINRIPFALLRDSAIDIGGALGSMQGERLWRFQNTRLTTGTGAATAKGIVTCATLGKTCASQTAIAWDEIYDLMHSVDPAYRNRALGCGFMMHDSILLAVRKLKDGDGNYLWSPAASSGQPETLCGWPVFINQDMASAVSTGAKTMLFGAFKKYKVRLIGEVRLRRLVERYAEFDQEGFISYQGFDGNLLDAGTHPVRYMIQA